MLILILIMLISIEPVVAISTFTGFGAIYGVVIYATRKILLRDSELANKKLNQLFKALQEGLGGIRDVLIGVSSNDLLQNISKCRSSIASCTGQYFYYF